MPTVEEQNAGFDAIQPDLEQIVAHFIPSFWQAQALQHLRSKEGRDIIVDGVKRVLVAAEAVRAPR